MPYETFDFDALSKEELIDAIICYDEYIIETFDDEEKVASGWVPVSFAEFYESEEYDNWDR